MDPATEQKLNTAKQFKQTADQAFKEGKIREGASLWRATRSGCATDWPLSFDVIS